MVEKFRAYLKELRLDEEQIDKLSDLFKDGEKISSGTISSILRGENDDTYTSPFIVSKILNYISDNPIVAESKYVDLSKNAVHSRERPDKSTED